MKASSKFTEAASTGPGRSHIFRSSRLSGPKFPNAELNNQTRIIDI